MCVMFWNFSICTTKSHYSSKLGLYRRYIGYRGIPIKLPCTSFNARDGLQFMKIQWSKCMGCNEHWARINEIEIVNPATPIPVDSFMTLEGWGRISFLTGDLIIDSVEKSDEGLYRCDPTGPKNNKLQLIVSGTYIISWEYSLTCNIYDFVFIAIIMCFWWQIQLRNLIVFS